MWTWSAWMLSSDDVDRAHIEGHEVLFPGVGVNEIEFKPRVAHRIDHSAFPCATCRRNSLYLTTLEALKALKALKADLQSSLASSDWLHRNRTCACRVLTSPLLPAI